MRYLTCLPPACRQTGQAGVVIDDKIQNLAGKAVMFVFGKDLADSEFYRWKINAAPLICQM